MSYVCVVAHADTLGMCVRQLPVVSPQHVARAGPQLDVMHVPHGVVARGSAPQPGKLAASTAGPASPPTPHAAPHALRTHPAMPSEEYAALAATRGPHAEAVPCVAQVSSCASVGAHPVSPQHASTAARHDCWMQLPHAVSCPAKEHVDEPSCGGVTQMHPATTHEASVSQTEVGRRRIARGFTRAAPADNRLRLAAERKFATRAGDAALPSEPNEGLR